MPKLLNPNYNEQIDIGSRWAIITQKILLAIWISSLFPLFFWPMEIPERFRSYYWVLWMTEGVYTLFLSLGYRACLNKNPKDIFIFTIAHGFICGLFNIFIALLLVANKKLWLIPENLSEFEIVSVIIIGTWIIYHDLLLFTAWFCGLWSSKYLFLNLTPDFRIYNNSRI